MKPLKEPLQVHIVPRNRNNNRAMLWAIVGTVVFLALCSWLTREEPPPEYFHYEQADRDLFDGPLVIFL